MIAFTWFRNRLVFTSSAAALFAGCTHRNKNFSRFGCSHLCSLVWLGLGPILAVVAATGWMSTKVSGRILLWQNIYNGYRKDLFPRLTLFVFFQLGGVFVDAVFQKQDLWLVIPIFTVVHHCMTSIQSGFKPTFVKGRGSQCILLPTKPATCCLWILLFLCSLPATCRRAECSCVYGAEISMVHAWTLSLAEEKYWSVLMTEEHWKVFRMWGREGGCGRGVSAWFLQGLGSPCLPNSDGAVAQRLHPTAPSLLQGSGRSFHTLQKCAFQSEQLQAEQAGAESCLLFLLLGNSAIPEFDFLAGCSVLWLHNIYLGYFISLQLSFVFPQCCALPLACTRIVCP